MEPCLTVKQAAKHLQVHPDTLRLWIRQERIKAFRPGLRRFLIPESELRRLMEAGTSAG